MWTWLANKLAAPILLALSIILAIGGAVQTVRLEGVSFFGWYAIDGYKPLYEALKAKDLQGKLDRANAVIAETSARDKSLDAANKSLTSQLNALHVKWDNYTPSEVVKYVPKEIRTACVPVSLLWLLDAAGTGADITTAAPSPGESASACSSMDVSSAESAVMQNVKHFPELTARIKNALDAWNEQRQITNIP